VNYPLVSVGLPVFNGEKLLAKALDALLNQDYSNLEIIISDNGSTDTTSNICKEFVNKDSRVQYFRSEENLGSSWNFNRVLELSNGKYFMWAAHDDLREPAFVRACVEKMEKCPEAVLCQAHTATFIEGRNEMLCVANLDGFESVTGLTERYRQTLKHFPATAIYGLYRSSAMRKTRLFEKVIATDLAFIQELSIYGNFVQVPEVLFHYIGRKKWNNVHQDFKSFLGKERKPWWYLPFVVLFCNHWSRISGAELTFNIKLHLWWLLIKNEVKQSVFKLLVKICGIVCPTVWKGKLANAIYLRWMHGPNIEISCQDLFFDRVIKPRLGWWR